MILYITQATDIARMLCRLSIFRPFRNWNSEKMVDIFLLQPEFGRLNLVGIRHEIRIRCKFWALNKITANILFEIRGSFQ